MPDKLCTTLEDAKELAAQFTLLHLGKFISTLNNRVEYEIRKYYYRLFINVFCLNSTLVVSI